MNRLFCVILEAHPRAERWDIYLGHATVLRPELERVYDFVDDAGSHSLHAYRNVWRPVGPLTADAPLLVV